MIDVTQKWEIKKIKCKWDKRVSACKCIKIVIKLKIFDKTSWKINLHIVKSFTHALNHAYHFIFNLYAFKFKLNYFMASYIDES